MACQLGIVRKNGVIAHHTVVRQMDIGHQPVVVTDPGNACVAGRADVEGAKLTDRIAITNDQFARFAGVFFILRHSTQ